MANTEQTRALAQGKATLMLVDSSGVIHHADPEAEWLLGVDCEGGKRLEDLLVDEGLVEALRAARLGESGPHSVRLSLRQGSVVALISRVKSPLGGDDWASVILTQTAPDEREARAESELRATIESAFSGFAHEVRNPIAAMLSITEAALALMPPGTPSASMLERIPALVTRVDKLIKESLVYGRPRPPERSPEPLRPLINWAVDLAQMHRSPVELEIDLDANLGAVLVDAEQVEQVLVNLLCNARDAARSHVWLSAWSDTRRGHQPSVTIEVSDDGPGVAVQHQGHIFEPFFTTKSHGTGLGLPIARELARLNGGELVLHATSEHGSVFRLYLEESTAPGQRSPAHAA